MSSMSFNSPPLEGWQAQPDGVVLRGDNHPALRAPLQRRGIPAFRTLEGKI